MNSDTAFDQALTEAMAHLRDVSVRDGIQSWDANKWPIDHILPVVEELNTLAGVVRDHGGDMAPVEAWGGGQVAQPAKFLHENPLVNLERIKAAAPNLQLQCLYRGRQCFGFIPVSAEIQSAAIEAAATRGIKVFRVFDMMNDITNLETGIEAMKAYNKAHPQDPIIIEGAISYISEPEGKRAWELKDYADFAVALAKVGCHEIAIKDYAGVGDHELPALVSAIRDAIRQKVGKDIPVNVHSHGSKPQVLAEAIKAGASKVDVAFGDLSGGVSHSNIMEVLDVLLKEKGFTIAEHLDHPIIAQMRRVEAAVAEQAKGFLPGRLQVGNGSVLNPENIQRYRMAGGAFSDLWNNYMTDENKLRSYRNQWENQRRNLPEEKRFSLPALPANKQEWFQFVLEQCPPLWEQAGRFNTVTPGAVILCQQAVAIAGKRLGGQPVAMTDYTDAYLDVVTGRYGDNKGMEKLPEAAKFRDAALMFRALKKFNQCVSNGEMRKTNAQEFVTLALISGSSQSPAVTLQHGGMVKLDDPGLEERLKQVDIARFRREVEQLPANIAQPLLAELTPGKSPDPTAGLAEGYAIIQKLTGGVNSDNGGEHSDSSPEDLALLAMLLRNRGNDNSIVAGLFGAHHVSAAMAEPSVNGQPRRVRI